MLIKRGIYMDLTIDIIKVDKAITSYSVMSRLDLSTYFNSNEDIYAYLKYMPVKDKNVLTVTGSGDQILYSILLGARNVDNFDINFLSYYMLELKLAAIKVLDVKEYLNFFPVVK